MPLLLSSVFMFQFVWFHAFIKSIQTSFSGGRPRVHVWNLAKADNILNSSPPPSSSKHIPTHIICVFFFFPWPSDEIYVLFCDPLREIASLLQSFDRNCVCFVTLWQKLYLFQKSLGKTTSFFIILWQKSCLFPLSFDKNHIFFLWSFHKICVLFCHPLTIITYYFAILWQKHMTFSWSYIKVSIISPILKEISFDENRVFFPLIISWQSRLFWDFFLAETVVFTIFRW